MKVCCPITPDQLSALRRMLPKRISLTYTEDEDLLTITVPSTNLNIQSDAGAFEGWVLLIHEHALGHRIMLDAAEPPQAADSQRRRQFLYRAYQFSLLVYDWFSLSAGLSEKVAAFMDGYRSRPKFYTAANRPAPRGDRGENMLLSRFCSDESVLYAMPECEGTKLYPRLPVDLFWGEGPKDATAANRLFPASVNERIDLWCVKEDALNLFLLKYQTPKMSVLSELFCYSNLLRDVFLAPEDTNILLAPEHEGTLAPFFEDGAACPVSHIDAWFLSDVYHRLFEPVYLCDMVTTKQLRFHSLTYNCDMPVSFQPT